MLKKGFNTLLILLLLSGCRTGYGKHNVVNVQLSKNITDILEQYLNYPKNQYLNQSEYRLNLSVDGSARTIMLRNSMKFPNSPNPRYIGHGIFNGYDIYIYGDEIPELIKIIQGVYLERHSTPYQIADDYHPVSWTIEYDEKYSVVRVVDHLGNLH